MSEESVEPRPRPQPTEGGRDENDRALISIPIQAESDDDAIRAAEERAASVHYPDGEVGGHVELVSGRHGDLLEIDGGVVFSDGLFLRQVQPDWKP